jgi:hypothetical protein
MKALIERPHVLVQHSGYGYGNDPTFVNGLETRTVTPSQAKKLEPHGVTIYPGYVPAAKAEMALMYPEGYEGMVPVANRSGHFLNTKIDGLRVFAFHQPQVKEQK